MDLTQLLAGLVSTSTVSAVITWLLLRRKMIAQADSIHVTSEIKVSEFVKVLADDLREQLSEALKRCDDLQVQVDQLKRENLELKAALQRKEIHTEIHVGTLERRLKGADVEKKPGQ